MNHRTWVRLFSADPGVIGRTLVLNGEPRTIIGVMPPRFEWNVADLWLPAEITRSDDPRSPRGFRAFQAHLRPGVTPAEAEAQLNVVAARRAAEYPKDYPPHSRFQVITVIDWVVREFRGVLYTLFGAVSLLLVIACCNVANMLLARATTREREIGIRAAIGASRGRIVRQLLVESALLAFGGLVAGCLAGLCRHRRAGRVHAAARRSVGNGNQARSAGPVVRAACRCARHSGLRVVPGFAKRAARPRRRHRHVGRSTAGRRQTRMRSGLVVAQVALSIVLLLGAGLLMRTFVKLVGVDLGFDPKRMLVAFTSFPPGRIDVGRAAATLLSPGLERVSSMPGVRSAALTSPPPPFGGIQSGLQIPGMALPPEASTS